MKRRVFVLGIDGVPHSYLDSLMKNKKMKNLARICNKGSSRRMNSVYPTISSVAWTSYMTGTNPASHGIFGFADRKPDPFQVTVPLAKDRKAETIWRKLSDQGKKVIVINVPLTFPPEEVNGILASGFLCQDINKLCYPAEYNEFFSSRGYIIDADAWTAREDRKKFLSQVFLALEKRFAITFELMKKEPWDFFQLHIMETDRLLHFFWKDLEEKGEFSSEVDRFFNLLDNYIGQLMKKLKGRDTIVVLSDHGFCGIKKEVQVNLWLEQKGLLKIREGAERSLPNYAPETVCYSLVPGRIFINLKGREQNGSVDPGQYEATRDKITEELKKWTDPETGKPIIDKIFKREEIYSGPLLEKAADLIVHPMNGYDLKARLEGSEVFESTGLNGMHTYDDAFLASNRIDVSDLDSIEKISPVILAHINNTGK